MKICTKCREKKDITFFARDNKASDKLQAWCKPCKAVTIVAYLKANPHKRSKKSKQRTLKAYYKDAIHHNTARIVRRALYTGKTSPTLRRLGYTVEELKDHLKNLFTVGMSWENYGEWELDHKTPRKAFTFSNRTDKEFLACWALSNIQPLWRGDNIKKGIKLLA